MSTINPSSIASQMAIAYIQPTETRLMEQQKNTQTMSSALVRLQSALQTFNSALSRLSGSSGVVQYSATFGSTDYGTVTASAAAQPGTYSVFVEQVATAHQLAFAAVPSVADTDSGVLSIQVGTNSFDVDFSLADADSDGMISQSEMARAINLAAGNQGKVSAMLVTVDGESKLVLTSTQTGSDGKISLDTGALSNADLKNSLSAGNELSAARNAIVWLGPQGTGIRVEQSSNTFNIIQGVTMSFTRAMAAGSAPMTVTVAKDDGGTAANVRGFIDAVNALNKVFDELTAAGKEGKSGGPFASDAGVRALRSRINSLIRQSVDGDSLLAYGIGANRSGTFTLDEKKLHSAIAASPEGLQRLLGKGGYTASSGIIGSLDTYLRSWVNTVDGQIKQRRDGIQRTEQQLTVRQARLDTQYANAYARYLKQFTQLQALEAQIQQSSGLFLSVFDKASA